MRGAFGLVCWLSLAALLAADGAPDGRPDGKPPSEDHSADGSQQRAGYLIRIPLPITGSVDAELTRRINRLLENLPSGAARPILVLQFNSKDDQTGRGSQFERCLAVARFLASGRLSRLRTVAYLPGSVEGHAVLPVLACEQIIMHAGAELGRAGVDEPSIDETLRSSYREIASRRRVIPVAFALGMLDKDLAVYKIQSDGVRYVLADELRRLQSEGKASNAETVTHAGELPSFTGSELRHKYHFVSYLVRDRKQLARVLKLPPGTLQGDPSLGGAWQAVRVELRGPVSRKSINWIQRSLDQRLRQGGTNLVCIWIDSPGGSPQDSVRLAFQLAELDPDEVRTVAYVPQQARADAALVALACDHLVMGNRAILGGPGAYQMSSRELADLRQTVKQLAARTERDWSLMAAMVDANVAVRRYRRAGTGEVRYFCQDELDEQPDKDRWRRDRELKTRGGLMALQAEQIGLVRHVVQDFDELKRLYQLPEEPAPLQPPWGHVWVERLAEFLAAPWAAGVLLFAAWFFLSAELSHPGLSAPGFASAVCFLLFFWSQFLHGTAGWLEILLFACGIIFVALEIFVIPGIGAFGIGGAIMVILSIVLASQSFVIPRNSYQLAQMPASLSMVLAGLAGVILSFMVMRRLLPETPYLNRMMLQPPRDEEADELQAREALVHWEHLRGKRGVTTTQLTPSGKARFGDDLVDVISRGEPVPRGTDVYVAEVQGNRVVVVPVGWK